MSNKKKRIWIGSAFLVALPLLLFYRLPVIEIAGEEVSYYIYEDRFELSWIHSIEKEEWIETYEKINNKLGLTETRFKTFGAGTPYEGLETKNEDGFIRFEIDIKYDEVYITISENVKTTLLIGDRRMHLYDYFNQYELVLIQPKGLPIWKIKRGDFL